MQYHGHRLKKLTEKLILALLFAHCLVACSPRPKAGLKILNATSAELRVTAIEVDGRQKSTAQMVLPALTAQKFSNAGYVANLLLAGGEKLSISVEQEGKSTNASCLIRPLPDGACLVLARYAGTSELVCGNDCADASSK